MLYNITSGYMAFTYARIITSFLFKASLDMVKWVVGCINILENIILWLFSLYIFCTKFRIYIEKKWN